MAIRTISDTGGFYNSTASWQEGAVPTSVDDVVSTSTSGPLTVNVFSAAKSIDLSQYANTLTMNNGITISGSFSLGTGFTISGTFGVVVNSSGSLRSYGLTWSNSLTFAGSSTTFTLIDDWVVDSLRYSTTSGSISTTNGKTITASNGLTIATTAQITGTTKIILTGGTWSHSQNAGRISMPIDLNGNVNFGTNIYSGGGTISYVSGTINSTGNTFSLQTGTLNLVNTNSIDFNNFLVTGSSTINGSNLNLLGNLTINSTTTGTSKIVMKGNSIWTSTGYLGNSIDFNAPGNTITLSSNIYYNTGTMSYIAGTVSASSTTLELFAGGNLGLSLGDTISFGTIRMWGVTTTINLGNNLRTTNLWVGPYNPSGFTAWVNTYLTITGTYSTFVNDTLYFGRYGFWGTGGTLNHSISISNTLSVNNFFVGYGDSDLRTGHNFTINGGTLSVSGVWNNFNYNGQSNIKGTGKIIMNGTSIYTSDRILSIYTNLLINPQSNLSFSIAGSGLVFLGSNLEYLGGTVSWNNNYVQISSSANITTGTSVKWYQLYFTTGTSTLINDCNVDILSSGGTVVINSNKFNVNSNLVINGAMSGTSLILVNGTGSQVWSATSYLNNNLTINKPSGTFSLSGNVYYQGGTLSYVAGSYSTTGSTLNLGNSCVLDSNGIVWNNVTNTTTATVSLPTDLKWSGTYSITGGTIGFTGSGSLTASSTGNLLANGSSITNFKNDIQVVNATLGPATLNRNIIYLTGNLNTTGNTTGTSSIIMMGLGTQTWSSSVNAYLSNNLDISKSSGILSVSGSVYYQSGTFSFVSGSYSTTGSTLNLGTSCILNSNGIVWNNVTNTTTATVSLPTDLLWTGTYSVTGGIINFTGTGSLTASSTGNLLANGSSTVNLKNDIQIVNATLGPATLNRNIIYLTGNLNTTGNTTGTSSIIMMGLGTQTWSSSANAYLSNNLDVNKPSGNLNISGNVYYQTGTFSFTSGAYSTTGSTLNLGTSCKINSNGIIWNNITNTATSTIDLPTDMVWSGTWTVSGGTLTFTNSGTLTASNTGNFTANGSSVVNLKNDIQVVNATLGPATINRNLVNITGNLDVNGTTTGTSSLIIMGTSSQTWTSSGFLSNNLTINKPSGTFSISGPIYYQTGTLKWISGSVSASTATLWLSSSSCTLDTNGPSIQWDKIVMYNTLTVTLNSNLNATTVNINRNSDAGAAVGNITFIGGSNTFTIGTLNIGNSTQVAGSGYYPTSVSLPTTSVGNVTLYMNGYSQWPDYFSMIAPFPLTINGGTVSVDSSFTVFCVRQSNAPKPGTFYGGQYMNIFGNAELVFRNVSVSLYGGGGSGGGQMEAWFYPKVTFNNSSTASFAYSLCYAVYFNATTLKSLNTGLISSSLAFNLESCTVDLNTLNFNNFISTNGTITLLSTANISKLSTYGNTNFVGNYGINITDTLAISNTTTGVNTPITFTGSGNKTWTSAAYLSNNVSINTGTYSLSFGPNIYYQTGTLSYVSGVVSGTNSTLHIGGNTNLQTSPITWLNINNAAAANVNLINNLSFTGTWSASVGVVSYTGSGILSPTSSSRINFSGNSAVSVPDSVNGITMSSITLTTTGTTQLRGTISCSQLLTLGGGTIINNASGLTGSIRTSGGLSMTGNASGTATIVLVGGTWSASVDNNFLATNLIFDGNTVVSGNVYFRTGTMSHLSGNVNTSGSTLILSQASVNSLASISTPNIMWNNFTFAPNNTGYSFTLLDNLNISGAYLGGTGLVYGTYSLLCDSYTLNSVASGLSQQTITIQQAIYTKNLTINPSTSQQVTGGSFYVRGNLTYTSISGTTKLFLVGSGNVSSTSILNCDLTINTPGKIKFTDILSMNANAFVGQGTFSMIKGTVDASSATFSLSSPSMTHYLIGMNKIAWKAVVLPSSSGGKVVMDQFFSGYPNVRTNITTTSATNTTIEFLDNFEKISKFINPANLTITRPGQLLITTDGRRSSTNRGLRYINSLPNGISKNLNISPPQLGTFLLNDPSISRP